MNTESESFRQCAGVLFDLDHAHAAGYRGAGQLQAIRAWPLCEYHMQAEDPDRALLRWMNSGRRYVIASKAAASTHDMASEGGVQFRRRACSVQRSCLLRTCLSARTRRARSCSAMASSSRRPPAQLAIVKSGSEQMLFRLSRNHSCFRLLRRRPRHCHQPPGSLGRAPLPPGLT